MIIMENGNEAKEQIEIAHLIVAFGTTWRVVEKHDKWIICKSGRRKLWLQYFQLQRTGQYRWVKVR